MKRKKKFFLEHQLSRCHCSSFKCQLLMKQTLLFGEWKTNSKSSSFFKKQSSFGFLHHFFKQMELSANTTGFFAYCYKWKKNYLEKKQKCPQTFDFLFQQSYAKMADNQFDWLTTKYYAVNLFWHYIHVYTNTKIFDWP